VPTGKVELKLAFDNEDPAPGGPATARLFINGEECGQGRIDKQVRGRFSLESLDIGMDALSPVSTSYPKGRPTSRSPARSARCGSTSATASTSRRPRSWSSTSRWTDHSTRHGIPSSGIGTPLHATASSTPA
jgi:hypothetical protein